VQNTYLIVTAATAYLIHVYGTSVHAAASNVYIHINKIYSCVVVMRYVRAGVALTCDTRALCDARNEYGNGRNSAAA